MQKNSRAAWLVLGLPLALGLAWITHGNGIIQNDPDRNISIPDELTIPLQVQAAFNDTHMYFRYRWPANQPHVLHDVLVYQDGEWLTKGGGMPGPNPEGFHEDRVSMMLDDGSVPGFSRYGGYIAIGAGAAGLTNEAPQEVTKSLPGTRVDVTDWASIQSPETLQAQRQAGYFLDLWHWRGHRSNPLNLSDDQWIAEQRGGDSGTSPYSTNWNKDTNAPLWMFNPQTTGQYALRLDAIKDGQIGPDTPYYLSDNTAIAFDPKHEWRNGDVIPRRYIQQATGSRGDIKVHSQASWNDGYWDVTLYRQLDTGAPTEDKILKNQGLYSAAFAIHRNATGGRWHLVSLPVSLGLGRAADLQAVAFSGEQPEWGDTWREVTLFYPGQVNWPLLISRAHAGAKDMAIGTPVQARHSEKQLAIYGVEMEFNNEITRQWRLTLIAGLLAMLGITLGLLAVFPARRTSQKGTRS
ncbi:MAG: ethylbenzene dehydrogenase-related protein [Halopseudomonas sp.]